MPGREEAFAQAFAVGLKDEKLTSNPDDATHETDRKFLQAFPSVEKFMKGKLQDQQHGPMYGKSDGESNCGVGVCECCEALS
ncbi:MAG: hypothetical protein HY986_14785 [Candidatus Melainabacteria bacterium]|nr:hypothetical protein [Candidatus Melainabacteria bacterium]